jgi:DNA-binding FadR family transcriptional regulator
VAAEPERGARGEFECLQEIHLAIADLSGNPVLALFTRMLMSLLSGRAGPRRGRRPGDHLTELARAHEDHSRIVEALAGGDAALARLRMLRHLETARFDSPWWREPPST